MFFGGSISVIMNNPEPGIWEIRVIADDINTDGHLETPEMDADFALVVTSSVPAQAWGRCCYNDCPRSIHECSITTQESCLEKGGNWIEGATCGFACQDPC